MSQAPWVGSLCRVATAGVARLAPSGTLAAVSGAGCGLGSSCEHGPEAPLLSLGAPSVGSTGFRGSQRQPPKRGAGAVLPRT